MTGFMKMPISFTGWYLNTKQTGKFATTGERRRRLLPD
jgi:hypothetical protein